MPKCWENYVCITDYNYSQYSTKPKGEHKLIGNISNSENFFSGFLLYCFTFDLLLLLDF